MRNEVTFRYIDQILRGTFADELRSMRRARTSFLSMSNALQRRGVLVSPEVLRQWCTELGLETPFPVTVPCISRPE